MNLYIYLHAVYMSGPELPPHLQGAHRAELPLMCTQEEPEEPLEEDRLVPVEASKRIILCPANSEDLSGARHCSCPLPQRPAFAADYGHQAAIVAQLGLPT